MNFHFDVVFFSAILSVFFLFLYIPFTRPMGIRVDSIDLCRFYYSLIHFVLMPVIFS